jgi:hypothetical protein
MKKLFTPNNQTKTQNTQNSKPYYPTNNNQNNNGNNKNKKYLPNNNFRKLPSDLTKELNEAIRTFKASFVIYKSRRFSQLPLTDKIKIRLNPCDINKKKWKEDFIKTPDGTNQNNRIYNLYKVIFSKHNIDLKKDIKKALPGFIDFL